MRAFTSGRSATLIGRTLILIVFGLGTQLAEAHFRGIIDTAIEVTQAGIRILYTLPADDLLELPGRDDSLGPPSRYLEQIARGWEIEVAEAKCIRAVADADQLPDVEAYQFTLIWRCDRPPKTLAVSYRLFSEPEQVHENLARVFMANRLMRWRFSEQERRLHIEVERLVEEWGAELAKDYFEDDPNRDLGDTRGAMSDNGPGGLRPADWRSHPRFLALGIEHILTGPDHVAMVIALVLVPATLRRLFVWITCFTIAHSVTLTLAFFDVLKISPLVTEPLVALTVALVGLENILIIRRRQGLLKARTAIVFAFGLIHGIGLSYQLSASAAATVGPPLGRLLLFNLGVELGQLAILLVCVWPVRAWVGRGFPPYPQLAMSGLISVAGWAWFLTRVPL